MTNLHTNTSSEQEMDSSKEGPAKRQAMKGQWQTPPVGEMFPSAAAPATATSTGTSTATTHGTTHVNHLPLSVPISVDVDQLPVPSTSDDYAKALQEAYRRGAEAAAAMSQNRARVSNPSHDPNNPNPSRSTPAAAASTATLHPNHPPPQSQPQTQTHASQATSSSVTHVANLTTNVNVHAHASHHHPQATNMGVPTPLPFLASSSPSPSTTTTTTSAAAPSTTSMIPTQHPAAAAASASSTSSTSPSTTVPVTANPMMNAAHHASSHIHSQPHSMSVSSVSVPMAGVEPNPIVGESVSVTLPPSSASGTTTTTAQVGDANHTNNIANHPNVNAIHNANANASNANVPMGTRSISLPNMSHLDKSNDEEAKRLKRLARNRASARLRRLRKKNLVESYEAEVGVLESSLTKLQSHRWGVGSNSDALLEALSMDRGQQQIDAEKRKELITSILAQQREQVRNLMDCQLENMTLAWIAQHQQHQQQHQHHHGQEPHVDVNVDVNVDVDVDPSMAAEANAMATELDRVLQLTPEQKHQLRQSSAGIEDERRAIAVIDQSLTALMSNSWLMNNGMEECTEQFTNILNPTQMSKFLLWADHNSEAIDQLDYVNAPPSNAPPSTSPTFIFGIDEAHAGEDG